MGSVSTASTPVRPGSVYTLLLQTLILVPLTLGIWALVVIVWVIIDFILILTGSVTDKYGRPLI